MRLRGSLVRALLACALLAASLLDPHAAGAGTDTNGAAPSSASAPTPSKSVSVLSSTSAASASAASLSAWRGGIDLYRAGVFTTQKTWYWCTAATVQISRNIVFHRSDHSASAQRAYFNWMRPHDRYRLPISAGVDAAGWTAGFRHFVNDRYRLHASATFDVALRSAVTNLRKTNLPVALAVQHGNHAWLLTGFTATADPARTTHFTITSVRVVGPLYGLQSKNGYDMPPDKRLTPTQLRRYFTPWHYAPIRMVWDGKYVSIQPSAAVSAGSSTPTPKPSPTPTTKPRPPATPRPSPTAAATPGAPSGPGRLATPATAASTSLLARPSAAEVSPEAIPASTQAPGQGVAAAAAIGTAGIVPMVAALLLVVLVVAVALGLRRTRSS